MKDWSELFVQLLGILAMIGIGFSVALWVFEKINPPKPRALGSSINYIPRGDRVIVKRAELPKQEATGVFLPASQQKPLNAGTVIAVGPGARNHVTGKIDPIKDLKPGYSVEFLDYAGFTVEIDGEEYLSMRESEIHGKR